MDLWQDFICTNLATRRKEQPCQSQTGGGGGGGICMGAGWEAAPARPKTAQPYRPSQALRISLSWIFGFFP